ncbi:hypothetical protein J6590_056773 [Homalodisca vitripennis]|nr:hypothetical protein J6590_056773 [Homalodisca vitripennis]
MSRVTAVKPSKTEDYFVNSAVFELEGWLERAEGEGNGSSPNSNIFSRGLVESAFQPLCGEGRVRGGAPQSIMRANPNRGRPPSYRASPRQAAARSSRQLRSDRIIIDFHL